MYDDILLPTDGSPGMAVVTEEACKLAESHDSTLHGLYVVDTASLNTLPMDISLDRVDQALRDEGERALAEIEELTPDVPVTGTTVEGSPSREILNFAKENDIDIIVMGTSGRSGVDRFLLGSVAERVVRTSPVPVLTVQVDQ